MLTEICLIGVIVSRLFFYELVVKVHETLVDFLPFE